MFHRTPICIKLKNDKMKRLVLMPALLLLMIFMLPSCSYNAMVNKEEAVAKQWANVESAYQRRADLIPNLVNVVRAYADFEQETLNMVIESRSKATSIQLNADNLTPENMQQFEQAQAQLSGALSRLLVVVERYPDLKANQNFLELQAQLEGTENRISVERMRYNEIVGDYNSTIRRFPNFLIANMAGFQAKAYFQASPGTEQVPEVIF